MVLLSGDRLKLFSRTGLSALGLVGVVTLATSGLWTTGLESKVTGLLILTELVPFVSLISSSLTLVLLSFGLISVVLISVVLLSVVLLVVLGVLLSSFPFSKGVAVTGGV